jgi:hypothetical protein
MAHVYNPRTQEAEAGGSRVQGVPELHRKTLSQKYFLFSIGPPRSD